MLQFEESWFCGEERDGFYIESMMKGAWAAQMEVLAQIEAICKRHGLRYFADWGTLLGAVRHQGYIPWDDDMDIALCREDYMKFVSLAREELPEGYQVLSLYTTEEWAEHFVRIVNGTAVRFDEEHLHAWHGFPYVAGVDIFPWDYLSRDPEAEELRQQMMDIVLGAIAMAKENSPDTENMLRCVEESCGVSLDRSKPAVHELLRVMDGLSQLFTAEEADRVDELAYLTARRRGPDAYKGWLKDCVKKQVWVPFETIEIAVPQNAADVLRVEYGDRYETPVQWVNWHDYPFYKKQQEACDRVMREREKGRTGK